MDLLQKINKLIIDTTVTGDVSTNTGKGKIDLIGGECPDGYTYCKKKKTCVPIKNETSVVGGSYISGTTTNIIGSGQTRVGTPRNQKMVDMRRKEPIDTERHDPTRTNIDGRKGLKFNSILGAYLPRENGEGYE